MNAFVWSMAPNDMGVVVVLANTIEEAEAKAKGKIPESYHYLFEKGVKNLVVVDENTVLVTHEFGPSSFYPRIQRRYTAKGIHT